MFSKREREQLEKLLSLGTDPADVLTLQELEGFLYGLVITPAVIGPSEWLPLVFGAEPPAFRTAAEAERLMGALMKAYNKLNELRLEGKLRCPFAIEELTADTVTDLADWVFGFYEALQLRQDVWQLGDIAPQKASRKQLELLDSFSVVLGVAHPEEIPEMFGLKKGRKGKDSPDAMLANLITMVPRSVATIQEYAAALELKRQAPGSKSPPPPSLQAEKIGRNDPCPCGSGKKFKKCCLGKAAAPEAEQPPAQGNLFDFPGQEAGAPARVPLREKDRGILQQILHKTVSDLRKGSLRRLGYQQEMFISTNPAIAFELVDLLAGCAPGAEAEDEEKLLAAVSLLRVIFEYQRGSLERGREGIDGQIEALQQYIAEKIFRPEVDLSVGVEVVRTLQDCRLEVLPALFEANERLINELGETGAFADDEPDPGNFMKIFAELGITSPFDGATLLLDQLPLMNPEPQLALLHGLAQTEHPLLRETAALMILHPHPEVREAIPALVTQAGHPLSPETLRRYILARNWLPEPMRPEVDQCIQAARKARVECAPLKGEPVTEILASPVDGAGAQGLWITAKRKGETLLLCILWKQSQGIIDAWGGDYPKGEAEKILRSARRETGTTRVERWYLDKILCHALHVGLAKGTPPPLGFLQIAEWLGAANWKAAPLDIEAELEGLFELAKELSRPVFSPGQIENALEESFDWVTQKSFAASWFEDDAAVFKRLKSALGEPRQWEKKQNQAVRLILEQILEPKRAEWLERLVCTALWLKANPGRPQLGWHKVLVVAEQLHRNLPMTAIPLMAGIAEASLYAALERGE